MLKNLKEDKELKEKVSKLEYKGPTQFLTGKPKKATLKPFQSALSSIPTTLTGTPAESEGPSFADLFFRQSEGDIMDLVQTRLEDYIIFMGSEPYLDLGEKRIPVVFRQPQTEDQRYGGIDILLHPEKFWDIKLKLRNRKVQSLYPTTIGWKNRMPFDHGHRHRRWYVNEIKLEKDNSVWKTDDSITQTFLDVNYAINCYHAMTNAINGYARRRWKLAFRGTMHNEARIPEGTFIYGRRCQDAYPFLFSIFEKTFATTDFIILCDRFKGLNHDSNYDLQSVMIGLYGARAVNSARKFRKKAKVFMIKTIKELCKLIGMWLGVGESLEGISDTAATWITVATHKIAARMGENLDYEALHDLLEIGLKAGLIEAEKRTKKWAKSDGGFAPKLIERLDQGWNIFNEKESEIAAEFADTIKQIDIIYPQANLTL